MKRTISVTAIATCALILLGSLSASAQAPAPSQTQIQAQSTPQQAQSAAQDPSQPQPLGNYARTVHKDKTKPGTHSKPRVYDNDNLPTDGISIVGPPPAEPAADAKDSPSKTDVKADSKDAKPDASSDRKKAIQELQGKLDAQKQKLADMSHELDLQQREYRLHVATYYSDAANRLRDPEKWDKQDVEARADLDAKQKAVDTVHQALDDLQEQARKAGLTQKEDAGSKAASDKDATKDGNKETSKNENPDKS